jgi:hypothetical protein
LTTSGDRERTDCFRDIIGRGRDSLELTVMGRMPSHLHLSAGGLTAAMVRDNRYGSAYLFGAICRTRPVYVRAGARLRSGGRPNGKLSNSVGVLPVRACSIFNILSFVATPPGAENPPILPLAAKTR